MKKLNLFIAALVLVLTACTSDDSKTEETSKNKLVINGKEFKISKAMSYFEGNSTSADFYYYDLAFLTEGMDFSFSAGETYLDGTGSILAFTLISETSPIEPGDYLHTKSSVELTPFYAYEPEAIIDETLDNQDWYDDFDESIDFFYSETFTGAVISVTRNGNVYSISGSGEFDGLSFSFEYEGEIAFDPASDDI